MAHVVRKVRRVVAALCLSEAQFPDARTAVYVNLGLRQFRIAGSMENQRLACQSTM